MQVLGDVMNYRTNILSRHIWTTHFWRRIRWFCCVLLLMLSKHSFIILNGISVVECWWCAIASLYHKRFGKTARVVVHRTWFNVLLNQSTSQSVHVFFVFSMRLIVKTFQSGKSLIMTIANFYRYIIIHVHCAFFFFLLHLYQSNTATWLGHLLCQKQVHTWRIPHLPLFYAP